MEDILYTLLTQPETRTTEFVTSSLENEMTAGAPWFPWSYAAAQELPEE